MYSDQPCQVERPEHQQRRIRGDQHGRERQHGREQHQRQQTPWPRQPADHAGNDGRAEYGRQANGNDTVTEELGGGADHVSHHWRVVVVTGLQVAGPAPVVEFIVEWRQNRGQRKICWYECKKRQAEPAKTHVPIPSVARRRRYNPISHSRETTSPGYNARTSGASPCSTNSSNRRS